MIPLQLRVRNFMCYRDDVPPLNFEGIHLACLTGPNGHGKSALLDAVTWALWGKARAKHDDELIHLGQSEMEVEFTFALGGAVYRVLRKRDSSRRGQTLLDLQVQAADGSGSFRSIAESGVRGTEEAISRLLRMDYETFTSSSFLLQGRANTFTTRAPAERKRVLGEILGLSLYEEYERRAKDRLRQLERRLAELDGMLRDIDRELARQPEYETELAQAMDLVAELGAAVRAAEAALRAARDEHKALELQKARLDDLERRMGQAERELREVAAQVQERTRRVAGYEQILAQRAAVMEGYGNWQAARESEANWNRRLSQAAALQVRQRDLERLVDAARRDLEREQGRLSERSSELERRAASVPDLMRELSHAQQLVTDLAERQVMRDQARTHIQTLKEEAAGLRVTNDQLRADMEARKAKIDLLTAGTEAAQCPLCGQELSADDRDQVVSQLEAEGTQLADTYRANSARCMEIDGQLRRLEQEVKQADRDLAAQPAQQRREAQLEQALAESQQAALALEAAQAEGMAVEGRLRAAAYAEAEQTTLRQLLADLEALDYRPQEHEQIRARVASLAGFEAQYRQLQVAEDRLDEERAVLQDLAARQERWTAALAADQEQKQSLVAEVARLPEVLDRIRGHERQVDELHSGLARARQALGGAQQKLDNCRYLAEERQRHLSARQRAAEEMAAFDELRLAFGKKGIPAMIIEEAIPEIEFEANQILTRMTDGRMHVRFDTQRETLKGDTVETLDINIADELGTRPYDLFSGGEAFRVDFAIRIALSKLLARRAGAQLQLLVIDEGFGTQDAEGRERLVQAITSIQEDFARILVITHIEELKDAFPVRIEVTKTATGSQYAVV